jgi:hypothetical protein
MYAAAARGHDGLESALRSWHSTEHVDVAIQSRLEAER